EVDPAAGELRAGEVDLAAGELRAGEPDLAVGEDGVAEVDIRVEGDAGEVQVGSVPRYGGIAAQVGGDQPQDGGADLGHPLPSGVRVGILSGVRLGCGGHPQISAENVDAHLPAALPVVRKRCQSMDTGQANGGAVGA